MLRDRHIQVRMVKDAPNTDPTLVDAIRAMSPEEIEQTSRKLMKQLVISIGAVIVVRVVATYTAEVIASAIEYKISKKL